MKYEADSREELQEAVELGIQAQNAQDYINDVIMRKRASVIMTMETLDHTTQDNVAKALVMYIRLLRDFERYVQADITSGELAQEELMKYGDDDE